MSRKWAGIITILAIAAGTPAVAAPKVVASILPLHSLAAGVMQGVGEPQLLVPVGASPHNYSLKPSDARALQSAELVIWIGEALENYLEKPLSSLAGKAQILEIADMDGLTLLDAREGGAFDAHDHGDHPPEEAKAAAEPGVHAHIHAQDEKDVHLWLDPDNARLIVSHIAVELTKLDPPNADAYAANVAKLNSRLDALDSRIKARLSSIQTRPYLVFHDAYQYFEQHFGTRIIGSITVSPDQTPGAKRIAELRDRIKTNAPVCVFREPQFPAPIVDTLVGGTKVRVGVLDPEGADMTPGLDAYFTLMDRIADSLATCLAPS